MTYRVLTLFLVVILTLTGCQSLPDRIVRMTNSDRFVEARALLDKREAKGRDRASDEIEYAKAVFAQRVEDYYGTLYADAIEEGRAKSARDVAREAYQLCPWSVFISDLWVNAEELVKEISELEYRWTSGTDFSLHQAREMLSDTEPYARLLAESPALRDSRADAQATLVAWWSDQLQEYEQNLHPSELVFLRNDFSIAIPDGEHRDLLLSAVDIVLTLPSYAESEPMMDRGQVTSVLELVSAPASESSQTKVTTPLYKALQSIVISWCERDLVRYLAAAPVHSHTLQLGEKVYSSLEILRSHPSFRNGLAKGHIARARSLITGGPATPLALVHLARADRLGADVLATELREIEARACAALSVAEPDALTYRVSVGPGVEPPIQAFLIRAIASEIVSRTDSGRLSQMFVDGEGKPDISLTIEDAVLHLPDFNELPYVSSTYFSHYESVPNPVKSSLEFQLNMAESEVAKAKSNYDYAVSSHNIYPTQFSLQNVNMAYNTYKMAIDRYNNLVNIYNLTPSTVQREVYLPYSFQEGYLSIGWELVLCCQVGGREFVRRVESLDRDFVRTGARRTDARSEHRLNDPFAPPVTFEALMYHLDVVITSIFADINMMLLQLEYESRFELLPEESRCLSWLLHPWGIQTELIDSLDLPHWMSTAAATIEIVPTKSPLPRVTVSKAGAKYLTSSSPKDAAAAMGQYVCLITSSDRGNIVGSGSGTLIGDNGLVLTCAHILLSSSLEVRFPSGKHTGTYEADVVFENRRRDVALIRVRGLRNSDHAALRLTKSAFKGESIIAIGNPSIGTSGMNVGGVSTGIVSNPNAEAFGQAQLIADITVASGSSGGPIFSLESGEVLGVVLAVMQPGINIEGVSSSGYYCLAAPAEKLNEWLGISWR